MEIDKKGKIPFTTMEELELDNNIVLVDGDKVSNIMRESNISLCGIFLYFFIYIF